VDRLTGYSERFNGLRERLEDSKATLADERDALQADYQRIIRAVLACDPQPASSRPQDDHLEPPWEVIARIRQERDALREDVERLTNSVVSHVADWRASVTRIRQVEHSYDILKGVVSKVTAERDALREEREYVASVKAAVVDTVIGMDNEGNPTSGINYLQRLRQLVVAEKERDALRDDMRALAESARSLTSLWVLRGGNVVSPPAHELLPVLVRMNTVLARPGIRRVMEGL
jgi:hypothetical protein